MESLDELYERLGNPKSFLDSNSPGHISKIFYEKRKNVLTQRLITVNIYAS